MLKNILKLKGVQKLTNDAQKSVKGGREMCISPKTGECCSSAPICRAICGDTV